MKNNNKVIIILLAIIICLAIGSGCGFYIILSNNNDSNNPSSVVSSLKLDDTKEWIYAADYDLSTNKDSYTVANRTIKAKDLVVPYININSNDAKNANKEIYKLYKKLIDNFNEYSKEATYYNTVEYKNYVNNDIVSVVITTTAGGTDLPVYSYYTYNFNIKTGNLVSYKDAYTYVGFNENSISNSVKSSITTIMNNDYNGINDFDNYKNRTINNYTNSVTNNTVDFYIDENKKLNVVVTFEFPVGRGEKDTIVTVK